MNPGPGSFQPMRTTRQADLLQLLQSAMPPIKAA